MAESPDVELKKELYRAPDPKSRSGEVGSQQMLGEGPRFSWHLGLLFCLMKMKASGEDMGSQKARTFEAMLYIG